MKKIIKASANKAKKLNNLIEAMNREGVDEHEMFTYLIETLPTDTCYRMMVDLAEVCGLDVNELMAEIAK